MGPAPRDRSPDLLGISAALGSLPYAGCQHVANEYATVAGTRDDELSLAQFLNQLPGELENDEGGASRD